MENPQTQSPAEFLAAENRRNNELQLGKILLPLVEDVLARQRLADLQTMNQHSNKPALTQNQQRGQEIRNSVLRLSSAANPAIVKRLENQVPRN